MCPEETIAVGALARGQGHVNSPAELLSWPMFRSEFGTRLLAMLVMRWGPRVAPPGKEQLKPLTPLHGKGGVAE